MNRHCKALSKILIALLPFTLCSCPHPRNERPKYLPIKNKNEILENSSLPGGIGPIPEWVLEIESSKEIRTSRGRVFFITFKETDTLEDLDGKKELSLYLSYYLPDYEKLLGVLKLEKNGKYWHRLKSGKYQVFFRYEITRDSINTALKRQNEFSEKTRAFLYKLK